MKMPETMTYNLGDASENDHWLSAFADGETLPAMNQEHPLDDVMTQQLFYCQVTRQLLRGNLAACGQHETLSWHRTQMSVLWAKVDAAGDKQA
ncbi:MAG: hypothetical protein ACOYBR_03425 [Fluviibacter sp.]